MRWNYLPLTLRLTLTHMVLLGFCGVSEANLPAISEVIGDGMKLKPDFIKVWPAAMVPVLELDDTHVSASRSLS